ncbi:pYEATS domain-containing protein [Flavobacterium adhaerens]|uniref:pYEATS domain-containing protein n=1 Tax=Flavobacterium adhaerens TaxID=3149043 RepID=UPI0032B44092
MINEEINSQNESELDKEKNTVKEAETSILLTLYMGLFLGLVPVVGFPVMIPEMGGKILFIGIILGIASLVSFFFLGTLFGMPKRNNSDENKYSLNNSLVEISEWLTKIIVGLGLVNLKEIPGFLIFLGEYVSASSQYDGQLLNIYSIGIVIYFSFFGLYIGYNYMRLVLSNKYKYADDNLIRKELEVANEIIKVAKEEINQKEEMIKNTEQEKEKIVTDLTEMGNKHLKNENEQYDKNEKSVVEKMRSNAKLKLNKGLKENKVDPQKGQWGSIAIVNDRELKATVKEEIKGLYKIDLQIVSTNLQKPLIDGEYVLYALHDTFGKEPFKVVRIENQAAPLNFYSYGSFTVGAFVDNGATELELDLAELPGVSEYFKTH